MKKIFKWTGIILGCLIVLAFLAVLGLYLRGNAILTKTFSIEPEAVQIPTDQASIQKGQKLATTLCKHCHNDTYSGKVIINDPSIGYVPAPNLTPGEGGAGSEFTDADWVRALRYGVDPEGRGLIGMPSQNYTYMSDEDLGSIIAYLKTVPPVNNEMPETAMSPMGKVLFAAGVFGSPDLAADTINRKMDRPKTVVAGASMQYGEYMVRLEGCQDCHGKDYTGGHSPEPGAPFAPDLTSGGAIGQWSQEVFITAVRTMTGKGMPWEDLKPLSDAELAAIYQYIHSLPAK